MRRLTRVLPPARMPRDASPGAIGDWVMSLEMARSFFLLCSVINLGILIVGSLLTVLAHDGLHRLTRRWFRLSVEQFDAISYGWIVLYKIGILLFNLVPCIVLYILK
jgi:hypothetical protein